MGRDGSRCGLHIRLAGNVTDEDRFAASELAAILSSRCTTPIPIAESPEFTAAVQARFPIVWIGNGYAARRRD